MANCLTRGFIPETKTGSGGGRGDRGRAPPQQGQAGRSSGIWDAPGDKSLAKGTDSAKPREGPACGLKGSCIRGRQEGSPSLLNTHECPDPFLPHTTHRFSLTHQASSLSCKFGLPAGSELQLDHKSSSLTQLLGKRQH